MHFRNTARHEILLNAADFLRLFPPLE